VSKPLSSAPHSLVIGGGVIGLTTAWALLQVGHRVSLIEQGELAGGASRANGGQLSYRYVSPLADAGVPWKAIGWLFDPEGPLCFRPEFAGGAVELAGAVPVEMPRLGEP
jgi:D-amino-acid dehydrogenase